SESSSKVIGVFEKFANEFNSVANGQIVTALQDFAKKQQQLVETQQGRLGSFNSITGFVASGLGANLGGLSGSNAEVNTRIAQERGLGSFVASRLAGGFLTEAAAAAGFEPAQKLLDS